MAEPLRERLQPNLLERLTDDEPGNAREARESRAGAALVRASVVDNLGALFNAVCLEADTDLSAYPEVRRSVLNYGLPALTGCSAAGLQLRELERELRIAVLDFEPRLLADTVRVRALTEGTDMKRHNVIVFQIEAQLWAQPDPVALSLRTTLDLGSRQCVVAEVRGARGAP
ncbi:MAG: type VI secretion system baseplate subunit TssE [Pseudomonadota bacterium]